MYDTRFYHNLVWDQCVVNLLLLKEFSSFIPFLIVLLILYFRLGEKLNPWISKVPQIEKAVSYPKKWFFGR